MLRLTAMTQYQAMRWLCRFDPEARIFWFLCYLRNNSDLKEDVAINIYDFSDIKEAWEFY